MIFSNLEKIILVLSFDFDSSSNYSCIPSINFADATIIHTFEMRSMEFYQEIGARKSVH